MSEKQQKTFATMDGNTAASSVAYQFSDVAAIYPITPSSPMGELADEWSAKGKLNLFGQPVEVIEMQSEGGASGAIHGALCAGALTTTFTASQGLLLMIPNMHKIAGEMLPTVFHVSARSLACQSLSIFADHSDVMATRNTGFALMSASSVQEVQDLAVVSHLATLETRVPFLNFFDGFRTSHEIQKIEVISPETMEAMLNQKHVEAFRNNALSPERPVAKVGAQNPDVYFQGRETVNKYYDITPDTVKKYMKLLGEKTGRYYNLFDYVGDPNAEKIIISMTSSNETIEETVNYLTSKGEKVGAIKVRLYRPFSIKDFVEVLPKTVKKIAVLDRTKEPGAAGEPLYLDIVAALKGRSDLTIIGGRYGLSSKEFTPTMVKAVYDHLDNEAFHGFTVGIEDDVTNKSVKIREEIDAEPEDVIRCKFWGYGSDGTVSANKNSIKIIGENTDKTVQGYFSYDSKKAGGITVSHLRFGKQKIQSQYLLKTSDFIALHKHPYIGRYDILKGIKEEGTFLLNSPWSPPQAFKNLTKDMQKTIIKKKIKFYTIDATKIAKEVGLGNRINTVMQAAFFKISGILPEKEAIQLMKDAALKVFKHKGMDIVKMNWKAIDKSAAALKKVKVTKVNMKSAPELQLIPKNADAFAKEVVLPVMMLKGDDIPVSKMPIDGAVPTGTMKLEKRGIADTVPTWISKHCIQCGFCAFVCPHAAIRIKQIDQKSLKKAPRSFKTLNSNLKNEKNLKFRVQVYPEDCTGCENCVVECPTNPKSLVMTPIGKVRKAGENQNQEFFDTLPDDVTDGALPGTIKWSQLKEPLFEFSGACAGCGETPYIKIATQLFGDRMIIANATGCSSIFGGTFPTIPYSKNKEGKGPAWANSLFEDNAEYGFGFRLAIDSNRRQLKTNIENLLKSGTTDTLKSALNEILGLWDKTDDAAKNAAKKVLKCLPEALSKAYGKSKPILQKIHELKDYFVDKSVWVIGGDGWAYDIGFGGLDHVLAKGRDVNMLVLDTEVYSNTGGQASKATPRGAVAKFAYAGKEQPKKNLGLMCMSYGNVYVANINLGSNKAQVVKAFMEAESYDGPSIIIAYSPCIAHGINMHESTLEGKRATDSGYWPLFRFDPRLKEPFLWDTRDPSIPFEEYLQREIRYKSLNIKFPDKAQKLYKLAEEDAKNRHRVFKKIAEA
ncbi:pyruvate:ferredoxin (flavodoxin) oxidoreductase, partial [Candidatus Woesearchaeota archaeon]|nr:pyruvate:ferredoxin (flavodoxin) oxidoreductase [Candidatus Woesearchaeota archaeon]